MIHEKLIAFVRMDPPTRSLAIEALVWLAVARLALLIFPFRYVAKYLGKVTPPEEAAGYAEISRCEGDAELATHIGWAVRRMSAHVPFKSVCLQQAVAAKIMLRRRSVQSTLHFGVAKEQYADALKAHAWLDAAGAKVTGYPVAKDFTEIACFV